MMRSVALLALATIAVMASPIPEYDVKDIPEEYKSLIPPQVLEFLTGLTDAEKATIREVAKDYKNFKNEDEALAALKEKSADLHAKAEKLHNLLKEKVDALGDEAKAFTKEVLAEGRKIHAAYIAGEKPSLDELKTKALAGIEKYKALSEAAKADLEKNFPITAAFFKNEKVQALANQYLKKEN